MFAVGFPAGQKLTERNALSSFLRGPARGLLKVEGCTSRQSYGAPARANRGEIPDFVGGATAVFGAGCQGSN